MVSGLPTANLFYFVYARLAGSDSILSGYLLFGWASILNFDHKGRVHLLTEEQELEMGGMTYTYCAWTRSHAGVGQEEAIPWTGNNSRGGDGASQRKGARG